MKNSDDIDLTWLRKKALLFPKIMLLPFLVPSLLVGYAIVISYGFPSVRIHQLDKGAGLGYIAGVVLLNVPDFISLGIYCKMLLHFRKSNTAVHPNAEAPINEQLEEFGGIWVGGNGDFPMAEVENPPPIPNGNPDNSDHNIKAVMSTLKKSVILSLLDMSMALAAFTYCHPLGLAIGHLHQIMAGCWIPFIVIKSSFKQLDGFWRVLCCRDTAAND